MMKFEEEDESEEEEEDESEEEESEEFTPKQNLEINAREEILRR